MSEHHRATHLGYLSYHRQVLEDELDDLDSELSEIRAELEGKAKLKAEKSALLTFRESVKKRLSKVDEQVDGLFKHESDKVTGRAEKQFRSAYNVHQEEEKDTLEQSEGFVTAGDLNE